MKILSITGGAANMYCGSCLRDNALATALIAQGHDVILLPLYTPTRTDEPNVSHSKVFFGGISVYLQQQFSLFRLTPKFLDKLWDLPGVIRAFSSRGVAVDAPSLGALTVSMLEGRDGRQRKEVDNLVEWLKAEPLPDLITIPYTLLISLARPLKEATNRPVVCWLQGEELFLESLIEPWKTRALDLIRRHTHDVDAFAAVSEYEADFMSRYFGIHRDRIEVLQLGVNTAGFEPSTKVRTEPFRIGFLGRIAPEKGLHLLADAYEILRKTPGLENCRLDAAGYLPPEHKSYLAQIQSRLKGMDFEYHGELTREGKIGFLQSLDVFSMPCAYAEPKGLPVLEAMACGIPVVQPAHGSFPEVIRTAGGGLLVEQGSAHALAAGLQRIWREPELATQLSQAGPVGVRRHYSIEQAASRTAAFYARVARLEHEGVAV